MIGSANTIQISEAKTTTAGETGTSLILPPGLANLGNTCWLNSCLKALYSVVEFRQALIQFADEHGKNNHTHHRCTLSDVKTTATDNEVNLIIEVGKLYQKILSGISTDNYDADEPIQPVALIVAISKCYPSLFDISSQRHEQQDADEFLTLFMTTLDKIFIVTNPETNKVSHLIRELFFLDIEVVTKPKEDNTIKPDVKDDDEKTEMADTEQSTTDTTKVEEPLISYDYWTKLRADVNTDLTDIQSGIKSALSEIITKKSPVTQINMEYERKNLILTLPKYLLVQLQRFQWKKETESRAKVIRKMNINQQIDIYPFLSEKTQKQVEPHRKTLDSLRNETMSAMNDGQKAEKQEKENAGYYDLLSIVTHQGRSADSGHYVAWTRTGNNKYNENALTGMSEKEKERLRELQQTKSWLKHDDERSSFAPEKILTDLAGGGDFHMVYICIYKAKTE